MTVTRRISKVIKDGVEYNIVGGGSEAVDPYLDPDSENPVQNKAIKAAIDTKLDAPAAAGSTGQFVRKGADGNEWVSGDLASIGYKYEDLRGPCQEGFHVPTGDEFEGLKSIMDGLSLTTGDDWRIKLHMPFAGSRNVSNLNIDGQGTYGWYWGSTQNGDSGYGIRFTSTQISYFANGISHPFTIRPFKNGFVAPTSDWIVITGTLGSAGIFWNQTDGIISITGDGTTGYTIADKNCGATEVYSDGDTLTQANMGTAYQWGNNYGFPTTGEISTSSTTQVDASAYGPGNYYSSSTFIKNTRWDSSSNWNLWGGITGGKTGINVGDDRITIATESSDGLMSAFDKKKLNNLSRGFATGYVDALVVGAGGAGGQKDYGNQNTFPGGGGGGGVICCSAKTITSNISSYSITVGCRTGCGSSQSCAFGLVARGGGSGHNGGAGSSGGSGGGGSFKCGGTPGAGGEGTSGQGCAGGCASNYSTYIGAGGGGGGAGGAGGNASGGKGGCGGPGRAINFAGTTEYFGAGGGGAGCSDSCGGDGGTGGGGQGGYCCIYHGTGWGAGGGGSANRYVGGSTSCGNQGIVMVRYPTDGSYGYSCATGGTVVTATISGKEYKIHCFTSNGTFCILC